MQLDLQEIFSHDDVIHIPITKERYDFYKDKILTDNGHKVHVIDYTTDYDAWYAHENTACIYESGNYFNIYLQANGRISRYVAHAYDDSLAGIHDCNQVESPGRVSRMVFEELFNKRTNKTFEKVFGYCDRAAIKNCDPIPLYYCDKSDDVMLTELQHVGIVDFTSHYPGCALGPLPTWNDHKEVDGYAAPTEEYPFAFYLKSGQCAEYRSFTTTNFYSEKNYDEIAVSIAKREFCSPLHKKTYIHKDEKTILCKAAEFTLDPELNFIFGLKNKDVSVDGVSAKLVLNSFIGFMHRANPNNKEFRLDHVAAIIISRAKYKMLQQIKKMKRDNCRILQIIVDSVIYQDILATDRKNFHQYNHYAKKLGGLKQEIADADFIQRGCNQYIAIRRDTSFVKAKYSGFNTNIKYTDLQDIKDWRRSDEEDS